MLAHRADDEGVACAKHVATAYGHANYDAIPSVVCTEPEIAPVGKTEDELKEAQVSLSFPELPIRREQPCEGARPHRRPDQVLADKDTDRILGVHTIGPKVGELIGEAVEACRAVDGRELNRKPCPHTRRNRTRRVGRGE